MDSGRKNATNQIRKRTIKTRCKHTDLDRKLQRSEKGSVKRGASIWIETETCNKPDQEKESLKRGANIWIQTENATNQIRKTNH
jgi:hypothetical protein